MSTKPKLPEKEVPYPAPFKAFLEAAGFSEAEARRPAGKRGQP